MHRTVAVVTTSRADYGHLYWPLVELRDHPAVDLRLLVLAAHLSTEFGATVRTIEADGFAIAERLECLLSSDTDVGMAKTIGVATLALADALGRLRPDLLLLIADRYEMLAPAAVALALRIPIAHIEGGEVSEGAIDHAVRNALTMMAHVHLTPTRSAARRVLAMGEEAWRVHQVGAPSLDHLRRSRLLGREELAAALGLSLHEPPVVVAYHPVTLARDTTAEADPLFAALARTHGPGGDSSPEGPGVRGASGAKRPGPPDGSEVPLVFCFPNADAGSRELIRRVRAFASGRTRTHVFVNLEPVTYWSLLREAALLVGNSSSGIMEAPALELPVVNVGDRQRGRERARNIVDAAAEEEAIVAAIRRARDPAFRAGLEGMANPYGDGRAAERIAAVLAEVPLGEQLLAKRAADLPVEGER